MNIKKILTMGKKYLTSPSYRFMFNSARGMYKNWNDEKFLKKKFRIVFDKELDLNSPTTYNEKLQWLKIYNRKPEYTMMVDKYLVRNYISQKIGEQHLIPLLGVWDSPSNIDFDALPKRFVLKCNHNSGLGMFICKDKSSMNVGRVKRHLRKGLKQNYFFPGREWPYKDVPPRIIAEEYMEDSETQDLRDYKFYCFNGVPKMMMMASNRNKAEQTYFDYFDMDFNPIEMNWGNPSSPQRPSKPDKFEEMIEKAKILSEGIPHVRVDFYVVNGQIYFGELTFFDGSGMQAITPYEYDVMMGEWIDLPNKSQVN